MLIEYVPFGDFLGYLRKTRGLKDTYYKDPDVKPKTSLTSHQLMKFALQIADGMSYLSSKKVRILTIDPLVSFYKPALTHYKVNCLVPGPLLALISQHPSLMSSTKRIIKYLPLNYRNWYWYR